jgi:hypothetical protein
MGKLNWRGRGGSVYIGTYMGKRREACTSKYIFEMRENKEA